METQRGAKAPLVSTLSQSSCLLSLPCRFPRSWMASVVHLGSPKRNKQTNERAAPQKGRFSRRFPPSFHPLLSRWLWTGSSNPSSFITRLSVFRRPVIPSISISLHSDIQSLSHLKWTVLFPNQGGRTKEAMICCILDTDGTGSKCLTFTAKSVFMRTLTTDLSHEFNAKTKQCSGTSNITPTTGISSYI